MKKTIKTIAYVVMIALSLSACKKEETPAPAAPNPTPPANESELITTMKVMLHDTTTHTSIVYTFSDLDGDGGNPAVFGGTNQSDSIIQITKNHVYECSILLLDQSKNPVDTISNEVLDEANDHMFFFNALTPTGNPYSVYLTGSMTTVKYTDLDANNRGIGLKTLWIAPSMAMTKSPLVIELKHQPNAKNGTYAPGETDVQVPFKLQVN